jgi:hypothetical protein
VDSRWLAGVAIACGAWVIWQEINFKGSSTLTPVLLIIGIGIVALGAAHLVRHGKP